MTTEETELVIRRILVALDASAHSFSALEQAVSLAAALEAELMGLFVEDINLIRFASLPFARQVSYPTGAQEPLDRARIERELKLQAESIRKTLQSLAERAQTPYSFRIARGDVAGEILAAASSADLVLLGKAGWSPVEAQALGSTALALAGAAPCALLLAQRGAASEGHTMAVYDGSPESQRVLKFAAVLAAAANRSLTVFVLPEVPEPANQLQSDVEQIRRIGVKILIRRLSGADPQRLVQAVQSEDCGLLVIGSSSPLLRQEALRALAQGIKSSILLVR